MDELAKKFEKEFSLVPYLSSNMTHGVWFLDNKASHHMTRSRDLFTNMVEENPDIHVELGDNSRYVVEGIGRI